MNAYLMGESWYDKLKTEFSQPYFLQLKENLKQEYTSYHCLPKVENIFNVFKFTPFESVKVIIISQDPYPFGDHAHGIAFSSQQKDTPA
ncbi:MAG: uracil-DNA glycosylase, partial [Chitinophagaceae bacterium]|nr:uracil-DNA glycosylase [Chitinophagaceae bacterium]